MKTIADMMHFALTGKRYEPIPRVKDLEHRPRGTRNQPVRAQHISHHHAIKGGISAAAVMAENITRSNPLMKRLMQRHA